MFSRKKFTLEEGQLEFDQKGYQVGMIRFQIKELQHSENRLLNEMQALEKKGKQAREKLKKTEVIKAATTPEEEPQVDEAA